MKLGYLLRKIFDRVLILLFVVDLCLTEESTYIYCFSERLCLDFCQERESSLNLFQRALHRSSEVTVSASVMNDQFCLSLNFILHHLRFHQEKWTAKNDRPPLFVGLNGVQGAGKSFLVRFDAAIIGSWDISCSTK